MSSQTKHTSGAFEKAFETWLNQSNCEESESDNEGATGHLRTVREVHEWDSNVSSPCVAVIPQEQCPLLQGAQAKRTSSLVRRRVKSSSMHRFHAYKAVLKKYSRKRWFRCKKSLSPGGQTDDSGVVSPGCDECVDSVIRDEGCLSGDDSPPNIQEEYTSADGWVSGMDSYADQDGEYHDQPPELTPSMQIQDTFEDQPSHSGCVTVERDRPLLSKSDMKSKLVVGKYCQHRKEKERWKKNCIRMHRPESEKSGKLDWSKSERSSLVTRTRLDEKHNHESLCVENGYAGGIESENSAYVSRNGFEIGASDSGAGSQSESCCEESPRHEHDNVLSSGQTATTISPQFPCHSQHFSVIPSDSSKQTSSSGSPPLVLKLKKCEQKSNVKNSPPKYVAVEVTAKSEMVIPKDDLNTVNLQNHSMDGHMCHDTNISRSKRSKARRKSSAVCPCCIGTKKPDRPRRHSRTVSESSQGLGYRRGSVAAQERRFIRQCVHLSNLQTKIHELFMHLFPRMVPALSKISPEGRSFARVVDDVISLLQQAEGDDDVKDSEELSWKLETLGLRPELGPEPVYLPWVSLCRSPGVCLEDFREKVFILIQLLLPELTLSLENNCYRSNRELEKFLDKVIAQNKLITR